MIPRLIISFREIPPDIEWCKDNKGMVRRWAQNVKIAVRNIIPIAILPVRKELMWGLYNGISNGKLFRENSIKRKVPGGFDLIQSGELAELEQDKLKFEEFLYTSMAKTIEKDSPGYNERFRAMAQSVKHKLFESAVSMYSKIGIYAICKIEET